MTGKIGVNDLCACGSGKKYKKCCMHTDVASSDENRLDLNWQKLRATECDVIDNHLLPYASNSLPHGDMDEAFEYLTLFVDLPEKSEDMLYLNSFIPWYLFNCPLFCFAKSGRVLKTRFPNPRLDVISCTIAEKYLNEHGNHLSAYQKKFINAMLESYYSIYKVVEVVKGKSLRLYDMLLDTEHVVKERMATTRLNGGEIICSRIIELDGQGISVGMLPFLMHSAHLDVLELKTDLEEDYGAPITKDLILKHKIQDIALSYYLSLLSDSYNARQNMINNLRNTDGDRFAVQKLHYKLFVTPEEAIKKLLPLTLSAEYEDIIDDAEFDGKDCITKVQFPWLALGNKKHKNGDNTVMGNIIVTKGKLTIEVNSEERGKKIQKLLKKYLGENISATPMIEMISTEKMLSDKANLPDDDEDLNALPEVKEMLKQKLSEHYNAWVDFKIPALHNKTPRQIVKTKAGKAKLEALLCDMESNGGPEFDFNIIRRELGLLPCVPPA